MLEKLLKKTEFKSDAVAIARRIERAGLTLATIDNAPAVFGYTLYGHNTYVVVAAINAAKLLPDEEPKKTTSKIVPDVPATTED